MVQAIVWKEFREQGLIGLTLIVLGSGVLVAAAVLSDPPAAGVSSSDPLRFLGAGRLATLLLAVTAGTVCGGALFAAEREAGTLGFLEALPVSRWDIWLGKLAAGAALVVCQVVPLLGLGAALGLVESGRVGLQLGLSALHAFVWGVYGSTVARTTLGSVGVAIPAAVLAAFAYAFPIVLLFHYPGSTLIRPEGWLLLLTLMFSTPVALSAFAFTRQDRDRSADDRSAAVPMGLVAADPARPPAAPPAAPSVRRGPRLGLKALVWLSARQLLLPGLVGSAFALGFGLVLLVPVVQPVLAWPPLALAAGVLAGVTLFADEQAHGSARFWGERRLPVGRAWGVKLLVHAAFAAWLLVLLALPIVVQAVAAGRDVVRPDTPLAAAFRSRLFESAHLGGEAWKYLLVPAVYGFVAGHLCGLLFRKAVVATGVAGVVGGTAAAAWGPSLLAGGVHHWQLWLPVVAAVVTARLLMRPWAADRVMTRAPLTLLGGGVAAAVVVIAAGLGYRAVEVPDDPAGEDDQVYVQGLPTYDANVAGRDFRSAAEQFGLVAYPNPDSNRPESAGPPVGPNEVRLEQLPVGGLGENDEPFIAWLDKLYAARPAGAAGQASWHAAAAEAARKPTGLFEPPLTAGSARGVSTMEYGRRMGLAVAAHGLRRQRQGDPGAFVDDLRTALALGRNFRNGSGVPALRNGLSVGRAAFAAVDPWLRQLDGRPDLVREALGVVLEDERSVLTRRLPDGTVLPAEVPAADGHVPFDPVPHLLAERFVVRDLLKAPGQWLADQLTPAGREREVNVPVADLIAFGWATPWEKERTRRLVGLSPDRRAAAGLPGLARGRPGAAYVVRAPNPEDLAEQDRLFRAARRGATLKLAVRVYQAEHDGNPPADLAALVPDYLPAVPTDPYSDAPFKYRVATGQNPPPGVRQGRAYPAGQPVAWSVGPNRTDEGGWAEAFTLADQPRREDLVFPTPLVPKPQ